MKVIAACLLAVLGGKTSPTAEDIKGILASVGAEADEVMIELLISQIKGKDITELIATGMEMMGSIGGGGGGGGGVAAAAPLSGGAPAVAVSGEQKKEEKVEVKEESDEDDFTLGLFD